MKNKLLKRGMIIATSVIVGLCALPGFTKASSSRSLVTKPKITFNEEGVDGGDNIEITVTFTDTMTRKVPLNIELTRGAIVKIDDEHPITFMTNNKVGSVDEPDIYDDETGMDITTSTCVRNKKSVLKFWVEAPIDARNFQVILNTDSTYAQYKTVTSDNIKVISGLTIESPDILNDVDRFDVTGLAKYKGESVPANTHMFMEIVNQDPESPYFYEVQMVEPIVNDEYKFKSIKLSSEYEDGDYMIRVYLWDDTEDKLIGYAEKDVKFIKKPDILQLSIYCQQRGVYATINDPKPGQGVFYRGLYVNPGQGWYVPEQYNIQSKVILKSEKEAAGATDAKFVVTTAFGDQVFTAVKSGTNFIGNLKPLRTKQTVLVDGVERRPFVSLVYTRADGIQNTVYVGELEPILDPSGYIYDADTKEVVVGAEVTLYRLNEETNDWIQWVDPTGNQANPQTTNGYGRFAWDVENGQYEVRVYHPDYHKAGEFYSTLYDPDYGVINVPPEKSDIEIFLKKPQAEVEPEVPEEPEASETPAPSEAPVAEN